MSDILERLKVANANNPGTLAAEAIAEIERLRAGGCARDQRTTQYCGEAARLAKENADLREACVKAHKYLSMYDSHYEGLPALRAAIEGKENNQ